MGNERPKISIIVPVYNTETYLRVCLDSLVNQTLDSYEIIIVNDGSKDNSQIIIDEYRKNYPDIIKPYIKENGGVSSARNFGLEKAVGEYIGFVDSDDCVRLNMFELLYNKAKQTDSDIAVCNFYSLTDKINERLVINKEESKENVSVKDDPELLLCCKPYLWNKVYRREFWESHDFRFPLNQWFEDDAVIYGILYSANKITFVQECLYYYRNNNDSSITHTIDNRAFDIFKSCDSIHEFFKKYSDDKELMEVVNWLIQFHLYLRFNALIKTNKKALTLKYYWKMIRYLDRIDPDWRNNSYLMQSEKKEAYTVLIQNPVKYTALTLLPVPSKEKQFGFTGNYDRKRPYCYINNDRLRELQIVEYEILQEIDRVCRENDICYYLAEGSLLGAVRGHGFIPWDDDLDIAMPRKDYEKFIAVANDHLKSGYELINDRTFERYYLPFSKVISLDNHGYVNKLDLFPEKYSGPYVDVFPIDGCISEDPEYIEAKYRKIRKLRDMLLLKAGYASVNTKEKQKLKRLSSFYSYKKLHRMLKKEMICSDENAPYLCNFASSYHPSRQLVEAAVYGSPEYIDFESGKYPVPRDSDALLKNIYGNYNYLPVVRRITTHHSFYDVESIVNMVATKTKEDEAREAKEIEEILEIRKYEKEILEDIDKICRENGIKYFLTEDTLLEAVRSGGYSYNGNDLKIAFLREDFEKFTAIALTQKHSGLVFQYYLNIKDYGSLIFRIRKNDQCKYSIAKDSAFTDFTGPFVSAYPLDYAPSKEKAKKQKEKIDDIRTVILLKAFNRQPKFSNEILLMQKNSEMSIYDLQEKANEIAQKYNNEKRGKVCNYLIMKSVSRCRFPASAFDDVDYAYIDGTRFPIPKGYDKVLTIGYGDYMNNDRLVKKVKHSFT